jgi:hypothetical protein
MYSVKNDWVQQFVNFIYWALNVLITKTGLGPQKLSILKIILWLCATILISYQGLVQ